MSSKQRENSEQRMGEKKNSREISNKNLKPFEKGQSGNPNGRPKKLPGLDEVLGEVLGQENKDGKTVMEGIITAMANKALKGDARAAQLLLDRGYGKAVQPLSGTIAVSKIRVGYDKTEE